MKLALYMTGNYAKFLRRFVDYLPEMEFAAFCPNWQSYKETQSEPRISTADYLYDGFNDLFDGLDVEAFLSKCSSVNLYEVLHVDKVFYKKTKGEFQRRYVCAVGERLWEFFSKRRPDYLFIPIIETIDAMLAYRMAPLFGVRPIIYCHSRFIPKSFFSDSHYEWLPAYAYQLENQITLSDKNWAKSYLDEYRETPRSFVYSPSFPPGGDVYSDTNERRGPVFRLLRNLWLKYGKERCNKQISIWINFQIYFQRLFIPARGLAFQLIERLYIRPEKLPEGEFDFFPLHFSPESSINIPAPYLIDQIRVVDKIMLERQGNCPLILKEHPAMYGSRERGFYKLLKHRPFLQFVHRKTPVHQLIKRAKTVFSVTGTACLEAFLLGVAWVQYGENYLVEWTRNRERRGLTTSPEEFMCLVRAVSNDFVIYSPNISSAHDQVLFSKRNVQTLCEHLKFHIQMDRQYPRSPSA